ncbi:cytosolic carboxypeptidase 6-like isoform X10 [Athene cunicularia]|uniref:cytosolic carboxypeptidase 6-like isoform X10 n=1 Tax=Athene cunicularia TaxID=194338 RepID=UPI000EF6E1FA|nr:cytosolic carboxypeptidase 6-like isoform X10 [Athene cunicularia]
MRKLSYREIKGSAIGSDDIIAGNVSKYTVLPAGYCGQPKKGHLIFDACFESGNLGRVDHITEFEYDLFIRPDTCNPRFRVWFNFTVENVKESQRVIFNVVNFSKTKSLYRDGMAPMVKSTSRPKWQRIPSKNVYYYRCPDHRKNYVMSFAFCFDREDDTYQFAYCYPYTYTRLQHYLDNLQRRNMDYFCRELLGLSVQKRQLDLLTITSPGPAIELEKVKPESIEPEPEVQKTFSEEANTSTYYPAPVPVMDKYILENGKVHLGSGIWVDEEKWHQLQVTQGDSKYTKNLAVMIWGTDVLKNRSVTGVATKKKKDAVPKPPLSPHKLSIVRECLYDRIAQETVDETEIAQRLSKVNKYICEKIMDINKSCKNEERRESAKYNLQ